jgi:transcriptional antiterminator NusG
MEDKSKNKKSWYVVQAFSGEELRVKQLLENRINEYRLNDKFGEIMVPTEEVFEMRSGKKRRSERKFFPGYVLVNMDMDEQTWHLVKNTPRVLGFIGGTSDKPAAISEKEAMSILDQVKAGIDKPKPKVLFESGEIIRVTEGPFADFNGTVEEVNYEKHRLRVAVSIFGRSTPVDLEFSQVEKT